MRWRLLLHPRTCALTINLCACYLSLRLYIQIARCLNGARYLLIDARTRPVWQTAAELGTLEGQTPQRVYDSGFEATQHVLASAAQSGTVRDKTNTPVYPR